MSSYVYMIKAGPFCKIGKADNPNSRINSFRTGCPHSIEVVGTIEVDNGDVALDLESYLHRSCRDAGYHAEREWFVYSPSLAAKFLAIGSCRSREDFMYGESMAMVLGRVARGGCVFVESPFVAVVELHIQDVTDPHQECRFIPVSDPATGAPLERSDRAIARRVGIVMDPPDPNWGSRAIGIYEWDHGVEGGCFVLTTYDEPTSVLMPLARLHAVHDLIGVPRLDVDALLSWGAPS